MASLTSAGVLWPQIEELAEFTAEPGAAGVTREVFTAPYMAACQWLAGLMEQAGLAVRSDSFGNLFGRLEGEDPAAAVVMSGSHIDTVPDGGRFDGTLGVLGAIEAVRQLRAGDWRPRRSVEVVAFAGEEPRFGKGCIGSRAMTGTLARDALETLRDRSGTTLAEAMRACGLDPDELAAAQIDPKRVHAFVELHIEQGVVLETRGLPIGLVTHIAAQHAMRVVMRGEPGHAGATPMGLRRDALAAAAEVVLAVERLAQQAPSGTAVGTVGAIGARPGAINVVAGEAELLVDIRDRELGARTETLEALLGEIEAIAARREVGYEIETISSDEPLTASPLVLGAAREACDRLAVEYTEMISGAVHDSIILGRQVPIGMIFVPSRAGVSHSPLEYSEPEDLERGALVLAETLRGLAA